MKIGRYPANSRKILTVDEAQFIPSWELRTISKAMEEGFLQIDRVQSKGYESQTRLILIANPKKDQIMDSFTFGSEALADLLLPTIIRRVDVAVLANASDVHDLSFVNRRCNDGPAARITPDMLRAVIYWAWTLSPDQICFPEHAEQYCLQQAEQLCRKYGFATDVPLVPTSDFRNKLARIAVAAAVLEVSARDDFGQLLIEPEHVALAAQFLDQLYGHDNCGLDDHSDIMRRGSELWDYERIEQAFVSKADREKHATADKQGHFASMVLILRNTKASRRDDLAEQVGCSVDTIKQNMRLLKQFDLIDSGRDGYVKKPKFNRFLRRFMRDHPSFVQEAYQAFQDTKTELEGSTLSTSLSPTTTATD